MRFRFGKFAKLFKGTGLSGGKAFAKNGKKLIKFMIPKRHKFKLLTVTVAGSLLGHYIDRHRNENTGCFRYVNGKKVCKYVRNSCCNKTVTNEMPACDASSQLLLQLDPCDIHDEKDEDCCKLCSEQITGGSVKCERSTVGNAFTSVFTDVLLGSAPSFVKHGLLILAILFFVVLYSKIREALR